MIWLASVAGESFCRKLRFGKRRNTLCISSFTNRKVAEKDPSCRRKRCCGRRTKTKRAHSACKGEVCPDGRLSALPCSVWCSTDPSVAGVLSKYTPILSKISLFVNCRKHRLQVFLFSFSVHFAKINCCLPFM